MSRFDSPLNNIRIASPCPANWAEMYGNERKRFCGDCKLNVYNISGMTLADAESLLEQSEGRLCVRYYRRADGTILTKDCPVGLAKIRQRFVVGATAVVTLVFSFIAGLFAMSIFGWKIDIGSRIPIPFARPTPKYEPLMGVIAMPSPTPTPKPTPKAQPEDYMMGKIMPREYYEAKKSNNL